MKEFPLESILGLILITVLIVALKSCEGNEQASEKLSRIQAEICEDMRGAKLLRCMKHITEWEEN